MQRLAYQAGVVMCTAHLRQGMVIWKNHFFSDFCTNFDILFHWYFYIGKHAFHWIFYILSVFPHQNLLFVKSIFCVSTLSFCTQPLHDFTFIPCNTLISVTNQNNRSQAYSYRYTVCTKHEIYVILLQRIAEVSMI